MFLQNLNPVTIDRCIDPVFSTCFNCWQYGHRYYECILPNHHKFCVNCGRMHVLIDYCPRCCYAYFHHVVTGLANTIRQKSVPCIDYYHGNNCYKEDVQDDTSQFRVSYIPNLFICHILPTPCKLKRFDFMIKRESKD